MYIDVSTLLKRVLINRKEDLICSWMNERQKSYMRS